MIGPSCIYCLNDNGSRCSAVETRAFVQQPGFVSRTVPTGLPGSNGIRRGNTFDIQAGLSPDQSAPRRRHGTQARLYRDQRL